MGLEVDRVVGGVVDLGDAEDALALEHRESQGARCKIRSIEVAHRKENRGEGRHHELVLGEDGAVDIEELDQDLGFLFVDVDAVPVGPVVVVVAGADRVRGFGTVRGDGGVGGDALEAEAVGLVVLTEAVDPGLDDQLGRVVIALFGVAVVLALIGDLDVDPAPGAFEAENVQHHVLEHQGGRWSDFEDLGFGVGVVLVALEPGDVDHDGLVAEVHDVEVGHPEGGAVTGAAAGGRHPEFVIGVEGSHRRCRKDDDGDGDQGFLKSHRSLLFCIDARRSDAQIGSFAVLRDRRSPFSPRTALSVIMWMSSPVRMVARWSLMGPALGGDACQLRKSLKVLLSRSTSTGPVSVGFMVISSLGRSSAPSAGPVPHQR